MSVRARPAKLSSAAAKAAALVFTAGAPAHGGETSFVAEPSRVAPGDGVGVQADLLTSGVAVGAGGAGQGSRDRDEVRLAPLPPGSQASRSAAPATIPAGTRTVDPSIDLAPFVALGWGLAALVVLAVRTRHLAGN